MLKISKPGPPKKWQATICSFQSFANRQIMNFRNHDKKIDFPIFCMKLYPN